MRRGVDKLRFVPDGAPISFTLETLVRDGSLGPFRLGLSKKEIAREVYAPDPSPPSASAEEAVTWIYGEIELNFEPDQRLGLIMVKSGRDRRRHPAAPLDWWVLKDLPSLADAKKALDAHDVRYTWLRNAMLDIEYLQIGDSGTVLSFHGSGEYAGQEAYRFSGISNTLPDSQHYPFHGATAVLDTAP